MFIEILKEKYKLGEPIFVDEILILFSTISRAQVFRYIKKAKEENKLYQYEYGVYYLPRITSWGAISRICADDVVEKKYICNDSNIYGVYSGIKLLNSFGQTTQMAGTIEIVTNKESMICRQISLKNRTFILKKPYCNITKENYGAYTILQLFNDLINNEKINENTKKYVKEYIQDKKISLNQIFELSAFFPAKAIKRFIGSGLINEIA